MSKPHKFFCRHCKRNAPHSIRRPHIGNQTSGTICRSQRCHVACLYTEAAELLAEYPSKRETNDPKKNTTLTSKVPSYDNEQLSKVDESKQNVIKQFYEIVKQESESWSKDTNPQMELITTKIFDIYKTMAQKELVFNLDELVGVEMLIGEYVYTRLSSSHPHFALQSMGILPMNNILGYLNTTLKLVRSYNKTRELNKGPEVKATDSAIFNFINDIYDAMAKLPDTVLINSMFAYEAARLNQYDAQKFESYDPATGQTITSLGAHLRISTNATYILLFKQHMLVNYSITEPDSNQILDLDVDVLLPFVDIANPDCKPSDKEIIIVETRNVREDVLNEMTLFVINRMLAIFYHMAEVSSFNHGNILCYLYPRF